MADVNIKKLNEFTTATLSDSLLVPLSNASGTGYKATMSAVRDYVSADTSYYVCGSNADASAKSVTATGFNLRTGGAMHIKFSYGNEADDVTLNVGGTGAYPLMLNGTRASSTNLWAAGDVFDLYFDGTNWQATSADAAIESKFAEVMEEINTKEQEAISAMEDELEDALAEISSAGVISGDGDADIDLKITDEAGHSLANIANGEFELKEFNSLDIPQTDFTEEHGADFEIADESDYVIMRIKDGHIRTKQFDSSNLAGGTFARRTAFTVKVNVNNYLASNYTAQDVNYRENPVYYDDNCVLYLPNSYKGSGAPTKLIIYCKHGASTITPTTDDIISGNVMGRIFRYMLSLGYGILAADGLPDGWASSIGLCERVVGNYVAVQSTVKAWEYAKANFNVDKERVFIFGYSQGGHYAQNVIDNSGIPIVAAAELSPVCSMRYHQWDLAASVTVGGTTFDKGARLNVARIFGYHAVTTNAQLNALAYDETKTYGFDPWTRNVESPYTGFTQSGNLWNLPSGTSLDSITMKKHLRCPLKIWCADNDTSLGVDVMKVFIKAVKNAGQDADIQVYTTGGHSIPTAQTAVGTFVENGETVSLYPIALDIADWFYLYGGY